jgi:alpha-ketoglutarate-dependent taurine dioxygenase
LLSAVDQEITTLKDDPEVTLVPYRDGPIPLFVEPRSAALCTSPTAVARWVRQRNAPLEATVAKHGAVVLRGFPIHDTHSFSTLFAHYPTDPFGYSGGVSPRAKVEGNVFEATRMPPPIKIELHQEMAYLPSFPRLLAFYCHKPAETGGETIIADMRRFGAAIPEKLMRQIREKGLFYTRNFRSPASISPILIHYHRDWQSAFYASDREQAEAACRRLGIEPRWEPDGSLTVLHRASGFASHPLTGEEVWCNQLVTLNFNRRVLGAYWKLIAAHYRGKPRVHDVLFGDGTPIPEDWVLSLYDLIDPMTVAFPWQAGDVMVVDNYYTAHGRNPYTGERNMQVVLMY